ncbi:trypsin-like peptidase domain-containing protein [Streptomyces sp. NPDC088736]|uniref:S1C family serine protease n=1 Tax=Streptomyces sp. NPDC088736 TaxID=3365881 RepID=UPI00382E8AFE
MDDGKPAKATWWNRPVPPVAEGETTPGAAERASAEAASPPEGDPGRAGDARDAEPVRSDGSGRDETSVRGEDAGRDETSVRGEDSGWHADSEQDGDFRLQRPDPAPAAAPDVPDATEMPHTGTTVATEVPPAGADAPVPGAVPTSPDADGRPAPLHDPDPYSTPPYGEPGPWAPAPPVQHPAVTAAHGIPAAASGDTPARTTPAPVTPSPAYGTPAPPVTPAPPLTPAAAPAQGTPAPVAVSGDGEGVPAGFPVPGASPAPEGPPGPYADASRPAPDPWRNYDPWAAPGPLQQNGAAATRTRRPRRTLVLGAVLIAVLAGGVGGAVGAALEREGATGDIRLPQAAKEAPGRPADSVAGIAARALPGVVTLHVRGTDEQGTGTGFVLDGRGHILTNNHVVAPAGSSGRITVTFSGGQSAEATVVGRDSGYDLAVVKVSGVDGLRPLSLGNSDSVQVGDPVVAIGAPFDLANTVTSGIISAKERPITAGGEKGDGSDVSYVDALQTDAPINPGNSGGPLLDSRARVIGINSAIRSADSSTDPQAGQAGSIGLGFAIPVNQARRVAEELINTGRATHPVIGVTLDLQYGGDGARVGTKTTGGPPVTPGGPGARAGIRAGDVITEVDGVPVHSGEELIVRTRAHRPGDRLLLTLRRDGGRKRITLVLGSADGG